MITKEQVKKINDYLWEIPIGTKPGMRVPGRFYASKKMFPQLFHDESLDQLANVATLPGIQKYALAMPDIHEGYGAPIGGVFATDPETGIISPGSIGYDINCGVRLVISSFSYQEIKPYLEKLADKLNRTIPSGVGKGGKYKLSNQELDKILNYGVEYLKEKGYAKEDDLSHTESYGRIKEADSRCVSQKAKNRGRDQIGTLGSGNHFLEIQRVEKIFEPEIAKKLGLFQDQITIFIHCGSRGLGHQVCTDYVRLMNQKLSFWGIKLPDRELACAPWHSQEAKNYFKAMSAAANFAWSNRQMILYLARQVWKEVLKGVKSEKELELKLVYDVAHNIGKIEEHEINGKIKKVIMHRKGATRAFPPYHPELVKEYQEIGQPVLIPGSMGTASYVLVGREKGKESFYSVCHGAGRTMSRTKAKKIVRGEKLIQELQKRGIIIKCYSMAGLAEEAPIAYKDIDTVVDVVYKAGLAKKVVRLKPLAVIKGE